MKTAEEIERRRLVLLSLQRALWGQIRPNLRLVSCNYSSNPILLRAVFDGEIDQLNLELMSEVEGYLVADIRHDERVELQVVRCDAPGSLKPHYLEEIIYKRYEPLE
ncbi:MAG: hypothetical protein AAFV45_09090 [Pseudomonadota bacterium]